MNSVARFAGSVIIQVSAHDLLALISQTNLRGQRSAQILAVV